MEIKNHLFAVIFTIILYGCNAGLSNKKEITFQEKKDLLMSIGIDTSRVVIDESDTLNIAPLMFETIGEARNYFAQRKLGKQKKDLPNSLKNRSVTQFQGFQYKGSCEFTSTVFQRIDLGIKTFTWRLTADIHIVSKEAKTAFLGGLSLVPYGSNVGVSYIFEDGYQYEDFRETAPMMKFFLLGKVTTVIIIKGIQIYWSEPTVHYGYFNTSTEELKLTEIDYVNINERGI